MGISTISINDAQAAPVAHVFSPARQGLENRNSVADWEDRASNTGIPVGYWKIAAVMSRPTAQRRTYRVDVKLSLPSMETISNSTVTGILPAPSVAYTTLCQIGFVIPERATYDVRKDIAKMVPLLLQNAQVKAMVEDLDFPI